MTLEQLQRMGLSGRAVRHRVATGRLKRLHRGVYAIGAPTAEGRWMSAVLAGGDGAVLSHRSAAALWELTADRRDAVEVTVRAATCRRRPGIVIHSGSVLTPRDVTERAGIPCTTLARTLLDLAAVVDGRLLERALDRAEELRIFDRRDVENVLGRSHGRRGARALAATLAAYAGPTMTRSQIEERFLALVRRSGLPEPDINTWIPLPEGSGYRPDFLWRRARLIIEVDGRAHHAQRRAFRHDRQRDRRLALAGYETRRYAASEVMHEPRRVVEEVRAFLAARAGLADTGEAPGRRSDSVFSTLEPTQP